VLRGLLTIKNLSLLKIIAAAKRLRGFILLGFLNGVDFFQTQYVFEAKKLEEYMKVLEDSGILEKTSFIIGLGPFASAKSAKWMNDNLFGVDVPDEIIKRLEQAKDQKEESKKICLELIQIFREIKGVKGIHLMGHKKEEVIAEIIKESKIS